VVPGRYTTFSNDKTIMSILHRELQRKVEKLKQMKLEVMQPKTKACRAKYYDAKVKDFKACKPAQWWKEMKQLSGFSTVARASPFLDLQHLADEGEDPRHLANVMNDAFLSLMTVFTPLVTPDVHAYANTCQQDPPPPV